RGADSAPLVAPLRQRRRRHRPIRGPRRRQPGAGIPAGARAVPRRPDRHRSGAAADLRSAARRRVSGHLLVKAVAFMYHDVTPAGREDASGFPGGDAARYKLEPEQFNGHLRAIAAAAAGPAITVDTADLQSARLPLLLTFDDGGSSAVRIA